MDETDGNDEDIEPTVGNDESQLSALQKVLKPKADNNRHNIQTGAGKIAINT